MIKLAKINLYDYYNTEINFSNEKNRDYLENLIRKIEGEENIIDFKEQLLAITQLYHDGLISSPVQEQKWKSQRETLDKLIKAGKISIRQFYSGEGIDMNQVREIILPSAEQILEYGNTSRKAKSRYLNYREGDIQNFGLILQEELKAKTIDPTSLMCIANGGFEPAYLAMNLTNIDDLIVARYSHVKENDSQLMIPDYQQKKDFKEKIKKEILIINDCIDTGKTASSVIFSILPLKPRKLFFASVEGNSKNISNKIKKIAEVLSSETSKKIISYLTTVKEANAKEISDKLGLAMNTVDYNLKKLLESQIIQKRKNFFWSSKGKKIIMYELSNKSIIIAPKDTTEIFSKLKSLLPVFLLTGSLTFAVYVYEKITNSLANIQTLSSSEMTKGSFAGAPQIATDTARDVTINSIENFVGFPINPLWIWFLAGSLTAILIFTILNWRKL